MKGKFLMAYKDCTTPEPEPQEVRPCKSCKRPIPAGAAFCPWCGKRQTAERKHRKRANGTGSITKLSGNRSKPWRASKNGIMVGTYTTRAEAQRALERLTGERITDSYNLSFKEAYDRWAAVKSREVPQKTMSGYRLAFSQCEALHNRKIREIARSEYQSCIIELENQGKSKSTVSKLATLMGAVAAWAVEEGCMMRNPARSLTVTAEQKTVRHTFSAADIEALKRSRQPAADIALILISCGCRPGELFKATLADCREDYIISGSKTEAGENRVIPIGPDGMESYTRLRTEAIKSGCRRLIEAYQGQHTAPNFTKRDWEPLMDEIGRPEFVPYDCRHTFITRAVDSGMDLAKLEAIVGHVDREITKRYTHLQADSLVQAVREADSKTFAVGNKLGTQENSAPSKEG